MDAFIRRQKSQPHGYSVRACLKMFGASRSGYYAWLGRQADKDGKQAEKKAKERQLCDRMLAVIRARNGIIPGKRTFRCELYRRYGIEVNVKHISKLMKKMNLVAQKPHKDAYKHQASHNHVCAAPENGVAQDFFIGPRKVILTDITYLYYGYDRSVFYLCVFRDAFTRENLGWNAGTHMDVELVKKAYDAMMDKHGDTLRDSAVYLHSDQGSQYLSTSFKQLLSDDGFVQSVSARGNSQDNAPMESFFARLKTDVMDMIAMCKTLDSAKQLTYGYLKAYNTEHYQYELAGLTPEEFYGYATTGIYPLDSYFGVPASEMMAVGDIKKVRRAYADEEARKRRESTAKKRDEKRLIEPEKIIYRDQMMLRRLIDRWKKSETTATKQIENLKEIFEQTKKALSYVVRLPKEKAEELKDPLAWRNHEELSYVFAMNELF